MLSYSLLSDDRRSKVAKVESDAVIAQAELQAKKAEIKAMTGGGRKLLNARAILLCSIHHSIFHRFTYIFIDSILILV